MKKQLLISGAIATAMLIGGAALATTGNDNGHGDHGCHVGEKNNDVIINTHCPSPSPSSSASPSGSPQPSLSPSPSVTPVPSAKPTLSGEPAPTSPFHTLPDTGGHGHSRH